MIRRSAFCIATSLALTVPAAAQPIVIQPRAATALEAKSDIRVTISMNFFAQAPVAAVEAASKAQEQARLVLYEAAGRECGLLQSVIASECRLESININVNRTFGNQQPEGFNANGNFTFHIKLK
jgi:hypothetical protein